MLLHDGEAIAVSPADGGGGWVVKTDSLPAIPDAVDFTLGLLTW